MRFLWDRAISKRVIASCDCFEQEDSYVRIQLVYVRDNVDDFTDVENKDNDVDALQQGIISSS